MVNSTKVSLIGDPILRTPCKEIDINTSQELLETLLSSMYATMTAQNGIGLAANQIGHGVRVFILKTDSGYAEYINPEIQYAFNAVDFDGEGCLSIPGVSAKTKRFNEVHLKWFDRSGTEHKELFENMRAFAVQHEMDHLNGKLYVDQFGPVKRQLILDKHRKFLRG